MILTDDNRDPRLHPTRQNMIGGMQWLVEGAQPHDSLFIHCGCYHRGTSLCLYRLDSGHGGQKKAEDDEEADGLDEGKPIHHRYLYTSPRYAPSYFSIGL